MKLSNLTILGLLSLSSLNAEAASFSVTEYVKSHFISSISLGTGWGRGGEAQTLTLAPNVDKTFTADKPSQNVMNGEVFAGVQQTLPHTLIGQIGIAVAATSETYLSGDIWDDALPIFNNCTYQYQLSHSQIALKGKLLFDRGYPVIPWISATLGVGFNRASNFTNTPIITEAVAMPNFASHTTTSFTYALGLGFQQQVNQHWQVGAGYEFADWGSSSLAPSSQQTTARALSLSHYHTNSLVFNVTLMA